MVFWALLLKKPVSLIMGHVQMQIKVSTYFLAVITKEYHKLSETFLYLPVKSHSHYKAPVNTGRLYSSMIS